jgi:hypothetical protein
MCTTQEEPKINPVIIDLLVVTGFLLLGPGMTALVMTLMMVENSPGLPTISHVIQRWPNIACMILGSAATNFFAVIIVTAQALEDYDQCSALLAYLSLLALWATIGTALSDSTRATEFLHSVVACIFFFTSNVLALHLMTRFNKKSSSLIFILLSTVVACFVCNIVPARYVPASSLAFAELAFIWTYGITLVHVFFCKVCVWKRCRHLQGLYSTRTSLTP